MIRRGRVAFTYPLFSPGAIHTLRRGSRTRMGDRRALVPVDKRDCHPFLVRLQEEQEGDLLDVVAVVDAIVAEGMAEAPEFLNNIGHDLL